MSLEYSPKVLNAGLDVIGGTDRLFALSIAAKMDSGNYPGLSVAELAKLVCLTDSRTIETIRRVLVGN